MICNLISIKTSSNIMANTTSGHDYTCNSKDLKLKFNFLTVQL